MIFSDSGNGHIGIASKSFLMCARFSGRRLRFRELVNRRTPAKNFLYKCFVRPCTAVGSPMLRSNAQSLTAKMYTRIVENAKLNSITM